MRAPRPTLAGHNRPRGTGRVALVTGGGSGIGLAVARSLAVRGDQVVICGRDEDRLNRAARSGVGLHAVRCDVTDLGEVTAVLADIDRRFGRLDLLVNNAGVQENYRLPDEATIRPRLEREIALNLSAPITLTHAALPLLRRSPRATIVNVGSGTGLMPKPDGLVYSATKAALHSFTVGLRWQLAEERIRVVELIPPVVDTAMTAGREETKASPDDVARALVRGLERNRSEIYVGRMALLPWLVRFAPRVAASIMRKP